MATARPHCWKTFIAEKNIFNSDGISSIGCVLRRCYCSFISWHVYRRVYHRFKKVLRLGLVEMLHLGTHWVLCVLQCLTSLTLSDIWTHVTGPARDNTLFYRTLVALTAEPNVYNWVSICEWNLFFLVPRWRNGVSIQKWRRWHCLFYSIVRKIHMLWAKEKWKDKVRKMRNIGWLK